MEAVMTHPVAVAIAGLLMQHDRDLGGQVVSVGLVWILGVGSPELIFRQDGRQFSPFRRRPSIVSGRSALLLAGRPPGRRHEGYNKDERQGQAAVNDLVLKQATSSHKCSLF